MGNAGKPRKIKGKRELNKMNVFFFDSNNENERNCIVNSKWIDCKKGETAENVDFQRFFYRNESKLSLHHNSTIQW